MTNYKQPHKTMTTIEEIVKSFEKEFPTLTTFEPYGAIPGGFEKDCKTEVLAWLTQTLKDYGDAIREQERHRATRIVDDIYDYGISRDELLDALDFGLNKQKGTP